MPAHGALVQLGDCGKTGLKSLAPAAFKGRNESCFRSVLNHLH